MDYWDFTSDDLSSFASRNYCHNSEGFMYDYPYVYPSRDVLPNSSTCVVRPFCQQPPRNGQEFKHPPPYKVVKLPLNLVRRIPCGNAISELVDPRKCSNGLYTRTYCEPVDLLLPKFYHTLRGKLNNQLAGREERRHCQSECHHGQPDTFADQGMHLQTSTKNFSEYHNQPGQSDMLADQDMHLQTLAKDYSEYHNQPGQSDMLADQDMHLQTSTKNFSEYHNQPGQSDLLADQGMLLQTSTKNFSEYHNQHGQSEMFADQGMLLQTPTKDYSKYQHGQADMLADYYPERRETEYRSESSWQDFSASMTEDLNYNEELVNLEYEQRHTVRRENVMYEHFRDQTNFQRSDNYGNGYPPSLDSMAFRPYQNQLSNSRNQSCRPVALTRPYSSGLMAMEKAREILEDMYHNTYMNTRQGYSFDSSDTYSSNFPRQFPPVQQGYSTNKRKTNYGKTRNKSDKFRNTSKVNRYKPKKKAPKKNKLLPISEFFKPAGNLRLSTDSETEPLSKPDFPPGKAVFSSKKSGERNNFFRSTTQGSIEYNSSAVVESTLATVSCNSSSSDSDSLIKINVNKQSSSDISGSVVSKVKFTPVPKTTSNLALPYKADEIVPVNVVPNKAMMMTSKDINQTKVESVCSRTGTVKWLNLVGTVHFSANPFILKAFRKKSQQIKELTFPHNVPSTASTCTQSSDTWQRTHVESLDSHSAIEQQQMTPGNLCLEQQAVSISPIMETEPNIFFSPHMNNNHFQNNNPQMPLPDWNPAHSPCQNTQVFNMPIREDCAMPFSSLSSTLDSELNTSDLTFAVSHNVTMTQQISSIYPETETKEENNNLDKSPPIKNIQYCCAPIENCQAHDTLKADPNPETNPKLRLCSNLFCRIKEHDVNKPNNQISQSFPSADESSSMVTKSVDSFSETNSSLKQPNKSGSLVNVHQRNTCTLPENLVVRKSKRLSEKRVKREIAKRKAVDDEKTASISPKLLKTDESQKVDLKSLALKLCRPLEIRLTRIETDPSCKHGKESLPSESLVRDLCEDASCSSPSSEKMAKTSCNINLTAEKTDLESQKDISAVSRPKVTEVTALSDCSDIQLSTRDSLQRSVVPIDRPNPPVELCQTMIKVGSELFKIRVIPRQKPFCRYCQMFTAQWDRDISSHVAESHPYRCSKCFSTFSNKEERRSHSVEHQLEVHHCELCKRDFKHQCHINQHVMGKLHNQFLDVQRNTSNMFLKILRQHMMDANCRVPSMRMLVAPGDRSLTSYIHNLRHGDLVYHYYKNSQFEKRMLQFKKYLKRISLSLNFLPPKRRNIALQAIENSDSKKMSGRFSQNSRSTTRLPYKGAKSQRKSEATKKTFGHEFEMSDPSNQTSKQKNFVLPEVNPSTKEQEAFPGRTPNPSIALPTLNKVMVKKDLKVEKETTASTWSEAASKKTPKSGTENSGCQNQATIDVKTATNHKDTLSSYSPDQQKASHEETEVDYNTLNLSHCKASSSGAQTKSPLFNLSQEDDLFLTGLLEMSEDCETDRTSGLNFSSSSSSFLHQQGEDVQGADSMLDLSLCSSIDSELNHSHSDPQNHGDEQRTSTPTFFDSKTEKSDFHSSMNSMKPIVGKVKPFIDDQILGSQKTDEGQSGFVPSPPLTRKDPLNPQPLCVSSSTHHETYNEQLITSGSETWSISRMVYQHQTVSLTPRHDMYDWELSSNMCNSSISSTDLTDEFLGGLIGYNSVREVSFIDADDLQNADLSEGEKILQLL